MPNRPRPDLTASAAAMGACGLGARQALPDAVSAVPGGLHQHSVPLSLHVRSIPSPASSPFGPGAATRPSGHTITLDDQSFFLSGTPWMPVVGEFHYARYPRDEWRDELLKMKAGGLNTVSSYVFWIHHEEVRGVFDWSGQRSLRAFLLLCHEVGLKAFVRIGPWCHGEVRNGGFPDWVAHWTVAKRTPDPAFFRLAEPFLREQAAQMAGLLWKDGGPVIGIQLDNESSNADYLLALKRLARDCGIDVPFYAVTGWQGGVPDEGVLPLWGGYADGFWGGDALLYRRFFIPGTQRKPAQYPFACVEIGPGMMSGYGKRIKIVPGDVAAMALALLASGNTMPGFYMYHGGTNPDGRITSMNENHPHQLPVKDYDFQTALGACGEVREQYHLLRQQNLFVQDFGSALARMPAFFPDSKEHDAAPGGAERLRWALRTDGTAGFLFYINRQPNEPLPTHAGVQFSLNTPMGAVLVPSQPVTIPDGGFGCWPLRLNCDGVLLHHATAQLLCRHRQGGEAWYFLVARDGIPLEIALGVGSEAVVVASGQQTPTAGGTLVTGIQPGLGKAVSVTKPEGGVVHFVVLTPEQAGQCYKLKFAGREHILLTNATVLAEDRLLRLQSTDPARLSIAVFPPVQAAIVDGARCSSAADGIFARFHPSGLDRTPGPVPQLRLVRPAGPLATQLRGHGDAPWPDPAVYAFDIPVAAAGRRAIVSIHYIGDAARLYVRDRLVMDHYFNGDPLSFALWRIEPDDWPDLRLQVLPYSESLDQRLPAMARRMIEAAKRDRTLDVVSASALEVHEFRMEF